MPCPPLSMPALVGTHDLVFITLDTLRYDVAMTCWQQGQTPVLAEYLPPDGWERRHSPGSFTYAAHHSFFAGFLPTPVSPDIHPRLFAARFEGSTSATEDTYVVNAPDIVAGLADAGYHTICIGGVGFFNLLTPLSRVLPGLFHEAHWSKEMGVTNPRSTKVQVACACERLTNIPAAQRLFLFINVSALHQPNYFYLPGATQDTLESHGAALSYVDQALQPLFSTLARRAPALVIICSDHGTAYGEEGYTGHRIAHPVVWTVPYAHFLVQESRS